MIYSIKYNIVRLEHSRMEHCVSGNRLLHNMTSSRNYSLRIDLEDFQNEAMFAVYEQFAINCEAEGFSLTVANYSGNAGKYCKHL